MLAMGVVSGAAFLASLVGAVFLKARIHDLALEFLRHLEHLMRNILGLLPQKDRLGALVLIVLAGTLVALVTIVLGTVTIHHLIEIGRTMLSVVLPACSTAATWVAGIGSAACRWLCAPGSRIGSGPEDPRRRGLPSVAAFASAS